MVLPAHGAAGGDEPEGIVRILDRARYAVERTKVFAEGEGVVRALRFLQGALEAREDDGI